MRKALEKWRGLPIAVKVSSAYVFCTIVQRCLLFLTTPLFTRLLTTEQYGQIVVYTSWQSVLQIFLTLNLAYGSFSNAMLKFEDNRDGYIASVQGICLVLTGLFLLVYLPFAGLWNQLFEMPTWAMILMAVEMIFMTGNAISRMKVQTHLESLIMHPSDQTVRIGYEVLIPSPPCPSVQMPVHIHNHYVERNFVIMNFVYQIDIVLLRVSLILTVPITQRIEWWHGLSASYLDIVANSSFIVVSISHEIPVECIGIYRLCPPVNTIYLMLKSKGHRPIPTLCARRLVYQCPSAPRDDAIFQVGTLVIATGSVQRTLRTFQVECILLTGVPDDIPAIEMHGNAQVVRRFQTCGYCTTYFVAKRQCRCLDVEIAAFLSCTIIDERETAVDDCKCSSVFKLFTDTILNANHPVSKNGEAGTT